MPSSYSDMKFKPETVKLILEDIRDHVPYKIAAMARGVGESTFYEWISNGVKHLEEGKESAYADMAEALYKIKSEVIKFHTDKIKKEKKGHKGSQWILERVYWKYFSSYTSDIEINQRIEKLERRKYKENKGDK